MSVQESFRKFLLAIPEAAMPIRQIAQLRIPERYAPSAGYLWYALQNSATNRTFDPVVMTDGVPAAKLPDELFFDVEIYHPDPAVVETVSNLLHSLDGYHGPFGDGRIGALFVENQSDDYLPQVAFDEDAELDYSFLNLEIRLYRE